MTTITAARLCRLYQKAKAGSESAYKTLKAMGFKGTKVEVLRMIQEAVRRGERCLA
jgi:hypothetical protein